MIFSKKWKINVLNKKNEKLIYKINNSVEFNYDENIQIGNFLKSYFDLFFITEDVARFVPPDSMNNIYSFLNNNLGINLKSIYKNFVLKNKLIKKNKKILRKIELLKVNENKKI